MAILVFETCVKRSVRKDAEPLSLYLSKIVNGYAEAESCCAC